MFEPAAAKIDCHDCQKFDYDLAKGERLKQEHKAHKIVRYMPKRRPLSQCGDCPKKSPEHAQTLKLTPENVQVLNLFLECRAMHWQGVPEAVVCDPVLRSLFARLEQLYAAFERRQQADTITGAVTHAVAMMGGK